MNTAKLSKIVGAMACALLLSASAARAGTWELSVPASKWMVGGTGNFFGTATRSTGSNGGNYISFADSGDQFAVAEFNLPSFLSSTSLTAQVYGRINSTETNKNICMNISALVSTKNDTDSTWETNAGTGTEGTTRAIVPYSTANTVVGIDSPLLSFAPKDQATAAGCASVAACAGYPARLHVRRITTDCTDNATGAFEMIKVLVSGTTP